MRNNQFSDLSGKIWPVIRRLTIISWKLCRKSLKQAFHESQKWRIGERFASPLDAAQVFASAKELLRKPATPEFEWWVWVIFGIVKIEPYCHGVLIFGLIGIFDLFLLNSLGEGGREFIFWFDLNFCSVMAEFSCEQKTMLIFQFWVSPWPCPW